MTPALRARDSRPMPALTKALMLPKLLTEAANCRLPPTVLSQAWSSTLRNEIVSPGMATG